MFRRTRCDLTSRERLTAAVRGAEVDRKPVICWPALCAESDARVLSSFGLKDEKWESDSDELIFRLVEIPNPYGRALRNHVDLSSMLAENPGQGEQVLGELVEDTHGWIDDGYEHGADGILYLLYGARGLHTTPMEYGGHFLERDRELLEKVKDQPFKMLFVVGEDDAYLDFVSDLPADVFAWDCQSTGVTVQDMRKMRAGALATNSPDADIELRFGTPNVIADLETALELAHV